MSESGIFSVQICTVLLNDEKLASGAVVVPGRSRHGYGPSGVRDRVLYSVRRELSEDLSLGSARAVAVRVTALIKNMYSVGMGREASADDVAYYKWMLGD